MATTKTKERGIIFAGHSVRAIREDRKTQTRRVIMPQPPTCEEVKAICGCDYAWFRDDRADHFRVAGPVWTVRQLMNVDNPRLKSPVGYPGDRLWIRETWQQVKIYPDGQRCCVANPRKGFGKLIYAADFGSPDCTEEPPPRWRPSLYMPRWASRINLEVMAIGVERLHDISDVDLVREGYGDENGVADRDAFRAAWDKLNKARGFEWKLNPWVWVVGFRRLTK